MSYQQYIPILVLKNKLTTESININHINNYVSKI